MTTTIDGQGLPTGIIEGPPGPAGPPGFLYILFAIIILVVVYILLFYMYIKTSILKNKDHRA